MYFSNPWQPLPFRAKREASWSRDGYNRDWRIIPPGETGELCDIQDPGIISHLWFAIDNDHKVVDSLFPRKAVLQMFWDGADYPSVNVPIGDFFGIGHGRVSNYTSALFDMSINKDAQRGAFNTYHFHASWNCEMPCQAVPLNDGKEGPNLTGDENYVILNTEGEGTYIGCNLSIDNHAGGWWGEGDDIIFIDGEPFPGSLHGTGSEDYFCHAWGMQPNCYPYAGTSLYNHGHKKWEGQWTVYRLHVPDPIPFTQSIHITIEHGHNNHRFDDYSSTAYWYQKGPAKAAELPSDENRLPK